MAKSYGGEFAQVRQEALKRARAIQVLLAVIDLPLDVSWGVSDTSLQRAIGRDCAEVQEILHSARSCLRIAEVRLRGIADLVELDTLLLPPKPHTTCATT